jgi:hypothetical protein
MMQIYDEIQKQAAIILRTLRADGLNLFVTKTANLRIVGTATARQLEIVRLWKRQIIEALSPKCSNCTLPMRLVNNGNLWLCPFGCQSQIKEK